MLERYRSNKRTTPSTPLARWAKAQAMRARFDQQIAEAERRKRAEELRRRFQRGML